MQFVSSLRSMALWEVIKPMNEDDTKSSHHLELHLPKNILEELSQLLIQKRSVKLKNY